MRKRGFRISRGEASRRGQRPGSLDGRQPATPGRGLALSSAAFRVPGQRGATSLPGAAKPLGLYLCSHRHLHRNTGMERPRAPSFTANGLQRHQRATRPVHLLCLTPGSSVCRGGSQCSPAGPKTARSIHWPPCPSPCRAGLPSHSSEEQNETRGTDQHTCALLRPLGTSHQ